MKTTILTFVLTFASCIAWADNEHVADNFSNHSEYEWSIEQFEVVDNAKVEEKLQAVSREINNKMNEELAAIVETAFQAVLNNNYSSSYYVASN